MSGLRPVQKNNAFDLELPDNSTPRSLLIKIGFKEDEIEHLRVFVNGKLVSFNKVLIDGDSIWIGIILGGG